jgi:NIMA (never in mitosis gene a)-related kinase
MCSLKPPFEANSLPELIIKIINFKYDDIPNMYTNELKILIHTLLNKDQNKRPNINQILNTKIMRNRIKDFLNKSLSSEVKSNLNSNYKVNE